MNKAILVGNLTKDPELMTTTNGIAVCRFTLAVGRRFPNASGERETDFLNIVVWRGQAENCHKYLKKGSKAGVIGTIQTRSYDAQDGTRKYITEIVADEVEFLSSRKDNDDPIAIKEIKPQVSELEPIEDDSLPF
jgi:single-strand DNA-binding protein